MLAALLFATIHSVDFRNFTHRVAGQRVAVHDGTAKVPYEADPEAIALSVYSVDVAYGDLLGDAGDEAAVTIRYGLGGTGSFSFVYVYAMRRGGPVVVAKLAGGDRSCGGVRSVEIRDKRLHVVRDHSSSCSTCTDATIESVYRWRGNELALASQSISPLVPLTLTPANATLRATLPGRDTPSLEVMFPEHVTAKRHGSNDAEHLYLNRPADAPAWRNLDNGWEYERELPHDIHFLARATVQDDGILFHYEFVNRSDVAYDWIEAVTDPRMKGEFHDERLERTYVHRPSGFALLAETPVRLPARYLASYRWPVPSPLVQRGDDGVMHVNSAKKVDEPLIVTVSSERRWLVASFSRDAGNVWSNPELTCQHVDPQAPLAPHGRAALEVKILIMPGSPGDALRRERAQRGTLAVTSLPVIRQIP